MRLAVLAAVLMLFATEIRAAPPATTPAPDVAEVASKTFIVACVAYFGDFAQLRDKLQPGHDLYLPQLPTAEARPFLQGREGEVYVRPDAGVTLVLLTAEGQCAVFVRKVAAAALYQRLERDLRLALAQSFQVRAAGQDAKDKMTARFIDLVPTGDYRAELQKRFGSEPAGLRTILTTSDSANPDLQAIITIGTRQP